MSTDRLRITELVQQYAPRPFRISRNSQRSYYSMACPLPGHEGDRQHPDGSGSFSVDAGDQLFKCFGCGGQGNAYKLQQILSGDEPHQVHRPVQAPKEKKALPAPTFQGVTIDQLAQARNLDADYLRRDLYWKDVRYFDRPAIQIPYFDQDRKDPIIRYRVGLDRDPRFRWKKFAPGQTLRPYGLWTLPFIRRQGWCYLVEGETDFAAVSYYDLPVIGIPGASSYSPRWNHYFQDLDIYVWNEPGTGGSGFVQKIGAQLDRVYVVKSDYKDWCEAIAAMGAEA